MTHWRVIITVASVITSSISGITSGIVGLEMEALIDQRRPADRKLSSLRFDPLRFWNVRREFLHFYPENRLSRLQDGAVLIAVLSMVAFMIVLFVH